MNKINGDMIEILLYIVRVPVLESSEVDRS